MGYSKVIGLRAGLKKRSIEDHDSPYFFQWEPLEADLLLEGILNPQMIEDTVQLIREAIGREKRIAVIINNRAGGNGPLIAQQITNGFLVFWLMKATRDMIWDRKRRPGA